MGHNTASPTASLPADISTHSATPLISYMGLLSPQDALHEATGHAQHAKRGMLAFLDDAAEMRLSAADVNPSAVSASIACSPRYSPFFASSSRPPPLQSVSDAAEIFVLIFSISSLAYCFTLAILFVISPFLSVSSLTTTPIAAAAPRAQHLLFRMPFLEAFLRPRAIDILQYILGQPSITQSLAFADEAEVKAFIILRAADGMMKVARY